MRTVLTTALLATAMLVSLPRVASAQVTNPDYPMVVRSYMSRPTVATVLGGPAVPARLEAVHVPDSLGVGEPGAFVIRTNLETVSLPLRAVWEFGDGKTARGLVAQHAYEQAGTYDVRVTLENAAGRTTRGLQVVVTPKEENDKS